MGGLVVAGLLGRGIPHEAGDETEGVAPSRQAAM